MDRAADSAGHPKRSNRLGWHGEGAETPHPASQTPIPTENRSPMNSQTTPTRRPADGGLYTAPAVPAPSPGRVRPQAPDYPPRSHRLIPRPVRNLMAGLGWWQNPVPLPPSGHLEQTLAVLERYGWGKSLDFSPTGRMCIRGAQTLLEYTGHVTPQARHRAVAYLQHTLAQDGTNLQFFAWNDLPERTWPQVENLLVTAASCARTRGE